MRTRMEAKRRSFPLERVAVRASIESVGCTPFGGTLEEDDSFDAPLVSRVELVDAAMVVVAMGSCSLAAVLFADVALTTAVGGLLAAPFPGGELTDFAETEALLADLAELGRAAKDEGRVDLADVGAFEAPCEGGLLGCPFPFVEGRMDAALLVAASASASGLPV